MRRSKGMLWVGEALMIRGTTISPQASAIQKPYSTLNAAPFPAFKTSLLYEPFAFYRDFVMMFGMADMSLTQEVCKKY
jgi:hypothetical protein